MRKLKYALLAVALLLMAESTPSFAETPAWGEPVVGGSFFVTDDDSDIVVTYLGRYGRFRHLLYLDMNMNTDDQDIFLFNTSETEKGTEINLGKFPVGTEIIFRLDVINTGKSFYSGPGERNPDGNPYAQITRTDRSTWEFGFEDRDQPGDFNDCMFQLEGNVTQTIIPMIPSQTYEGSVFPWQYATNYSLQGESGKSVVIDLDPKEGISSISLDGKIGTLPSAMEGEYSTREKTGLERYQLLISPAESAVYYFSLYGLEVDDSGQYAITAHVVNHYLSDVSPKSAGNAGKATLSFKGLGFSEGMQLQMLRESDVPITPEAQVVTSPTEFTATFDLAGASVGNYEINISWPDGESHSLPFEITQGLGPELEAHLEPPGAVRPGRKYTVWLEYTNAGDADMSAPLFIVKSNCPVSMDQENIRGEQVQMLGLGTSGMPDVLGVGESGRIPFYFVPDNTGDGKVRFNLLVAKDSSENINWDEQKNGVKPSDMSDEEWNAVWPDLTRNLGNNWSEYLDILRDNAVQLKKQGSEEAFNVHELIRLEILKIEKKPTASVSGVLRDEDSKALLGGVPLKLRNEDGTFLKQTTTEYSSPKGHFIIGDLPDGTYEILPEGYYFESPVTVTISEGKSISDLVFYAKKVPTGDGEEETPEIPDRNPATVSNETGRLFMVWEHGTEIWWAVNKGEGWNDYGKIPDAIGSNPALVYDEQLLEGGTPGFFCAWESGISPRTISWSVGKISEQGMVWSEPQSLTSDSYADFGIVLITDANHQPLVLWLQKDTSVEDDSDLYYQMLSLTGAVLNWITQENLVHEELLSVTPRSQRSDTCMEFSLPPIFGKTISIPKSVPIIGGKHEVSVEGKICGALGCQRKLSGGLNAKVEVGVIKITGHGELNSSWNTEKIPCTYAFDEANLILGISGEREFPFFPPFEVSWHFDPDGRPISPPQPFGKAQLGATVKVDLTGSLQWKSNFPDWPSKGQLKLTLEGTVGGELKTGRFLSGDASGGLTLSCDLNVPPSARCDYCFNIGGKIKSGIFSQNWKLEYGTCGKGRDASYQAFSHKNAVGRRSYRTTNEGVAISEDIEIVKEPLVGTGNIYEGNPLLGDISTDIYNDGIPAIAKSSSGEIAVIWTKDLHASELGSKVYASVYQNSSWSTPVEITPETDFNKDTAAAFDSSNNLLATWSGASNDGLDYEQSSVEEILNAQENADIFYAVRTDGTWAQPRKLADLPGRDEMVSVNPGTNGEIMALWLNTSEDGVRIYSAAWNGTDWSAPVKITNAVLMDKPVVAYPSDSPVAIWAQDVDGNADTFNDWKLYFSAWNDFEWSSPEVLNFPSPDSTSENDQQSRSRSASARSALDQPPEECCCKEGDTSEECKDEDEPSPPEPPADPVSESSAEVVVSIDPNEKVAPPGIGEKHYVNPGDRLKYIVYFENKSDAPAPAQEVFIKDTLDPATLDWATLRVEEFSFADVVVTNPEESFAFNTRVTASDYRSEESKQWWVEMFSEFDGSSGMLDFTFRSLDPETGELPEDVYAGFLPPEDGTGRGQGYVVFSLRTNPELAPGTVIRNGASIVFDTNEPIITNEALNTIFEPDGPDTTPPEVFSVNPGADAESIAVNSIVTVTFNEAMDPSTITEETFRLNKGAGTVSYDPETLTATLKPSDELDYDTAYTVTITGVKDASGNLLSANHVWNFTTEAAPDTDGCPDDPHKTEAGVCGCGIADTDSDGDGTPDCNDGCPDDPDKTEPGTHGCGPIDPGDDNCFIQTVSGSGFFKIK